MSAAPATPGRRRGSRLAWILLAVLLGYSLFLHQGLGPEPQNRAPGWLDPGAFLLPLLASDALAPIGERILLSLAVFAGPALALALAIFSCTRAVAPRLLALWSLLLCALFVYYGVRASLVWSFFHWRWSAAMALFAGIAAGALLAPLLVARVRRRAPAAALFFYALIFLALVGLERNVTGTDPALRFSISPWPVLQVTALQLLLPGLVALMLGVALGLAVLRDGRPAGPLRPLAGSLLAALLPAVGLLLAGSRGWLPIQPEFQRVLGVACIGALSFLLAARARPRERWRQRARVWAAAALLCALPIGTGRSLASLDYHSTRDLRAQRLIDALDAHHAREGVYPDRLAELVEVGLLEALPSPRIGFALGERAFHYQGFGASYLLEFDAPRWVQCAYNPPYADDEEEEGDTEAADELNGAWSCPSHPPQLW